MKFSLLNTTLFALATVTVVQGLAIEQRTTETEAETIDTRAEAKSADFGCPFNSYACDDHCVKKGYKGGTCTGW